MLFRLLALIPSLFAMACVAGSSQAPWQTPVALATNGPAACYAPATFAPEEHRISHTVLNDSQPLGEALACDLARRELAQRSEQVCQTAYGSRTDIRNLTARTQVSGGTFACNCRQINSLFMQCTIEGDAICSFEAAKPGTDACS